MIGAVLTLAVQLLITIQLIKQLTGLVNMTDPNIVSYERPITYQENIDYDKLVLD